MAQTWTQAYHSLPTVLLPAANTMAISVSIHHAAPCLRTGCPFGRIPDRSRGRSEPRGHGYCCNACKPARHHLDRRQHCVHTNNCTGHGRCVVVAAASQGRHTDDKQAAVYTLPTFNEVAFTIPDHWACATTILEHIDWYMERLTYDGALTAMSPDTRAAWIHLESKVRYIKQARPLTIHVEAARQTTPLQSNAATFIDVNKARHSGAPAYAGASSRYNSWEGTGIDFDVQAELVTHPLTAEFLLNACLSIEAQKLNLN